MLKNILSVSAYLDQLNLTLKSEKAKIVGEVCNLKLYEGRSYMYFSIKDKLDQSTVNCFMWKRDYQVSGVALRDGLEVIVTAYPSIYKPNGGLSLQVESVELVGEGALQMAYELLKKKLESEGIFADSRKRALPDYPHRIGVITSKSGAVINDFLTNIGKFGFEITFVDSKVEGAEATKDLLAAVETLRHLPVEKEIDVLVIMRGGGSLESFQAFNNEMLVRALVDFPAPVLTGIGHDKDVCLLALASDKNVSTPTAVANLLNESWSHALSLVHLSEQKIFSHYESRLTSIRFIVESAISRIESGIVGVSERVNKQSRDILYRFEYSIRNISEFLSLTAKTLELSNPEKQLSRGYSIVRHKGKVVRKVGDVKTGEELDVMLSDGMIGTRVI